jgi:hypothetical protein
MGESAFGLESVCENPPFTDLVPEGRLRASLVQISSFLLCCIEGDDVWGGGLSRKEWHVRPNSASRPGGPAAKREPSPEGLGYGGRMLLSAVGAALSPYLAPTQQR